MPDPKQKRKVVYLTYLKTIIKLSPLTQIRKKANVLADFFTSVFTIEGDGKMPDIEKVDVPPLETMIIIKETVKKKLDKLNISKSPGPDGIHLRLLREVSMSLCTPLARICETSNKTGLLPEDWKCANITAIYKKGNKKVLEITDQSA